MKNPGNLEHLPTRKRFFIVALLFISVVINYMDRSNISIAAPGIIKEFGLTSAHMGWIFGAWGWSYALFQIPGGWLADRVTPRRLLALLLFAWSLATIGLAFATNLVFFIILRMLIGMLEAPSYPINSRVVTTWIPEKERARAIGTYTSAQFVGLAFLTPVLSWLFSTLGWHYVFLVSGGLGIIWALLWYKLYNEPNKLKGVNQAEVTYIAQGGGIPDLSSRHDNVDDLKEIKKFDWRDLKFLLTSPKLWGLYLGQFGLGGTTIFFLTWFPTYLVEYRHMDFIKAGFAASIPFLCGFLGVLSSGVLSDFLLKKGFTLGFARKLPIISGLLLSTTIIGANFVNSPALVIVFMAIAFFATGLASIVWTLVSSIAPERLMGMTGGVFNFIGALSGVIVPITIGYLVDGGDFTPALYFVCSMTLLGALSLILLVGKVERLAAPTHAKNHLESKKVIDSH
ncbi:MFS transporter [Acerihabitans sp.]|uniref:MFS transporter n=1 Tax=Acerihabitans sp. TaxID=2811394 RepID=UPI002EDA4DD3